MVVARLARVRDISPTSSESGYTLTLANAAHHAHPLLVRDGQVTPLVAKGMPLGMMTGIPYREVEFSLQSGDLIVLMTDGIIEAQNDKETLYGDSGRLQKVLIESANNASAEAIIEAVFDDVAGFCGERAEREDDMTLVVVKVL